MRVLILAGAGEKAFVAGADIGELVRRSTHLGHSETRWRQEVYTRIEQLEIPSIAGINGWALGTPAWNFRWPEPRVWLRTGQNSDSPR